MLSLVKKPRSEYGLFKVCTPSHTVVGESSPYVAKLRFYIHEQFLCMMLLSHHGIQIHDFMADLGSIPPHRRVTASYSTGHASSVCVWGRMGGTFSCELNGGGGGFSFT
jgi:hypothetical protein